MPVIKIKGYYLHAPTTSERFFNGKHKYAIEPARKQQIFFKSADKMPKYNKLIIKRLAVRYEGEELTEKLDELLFCDLETALEVLKED